MMFPVIHSTLDPEALRETVVDKFRFLNPVSCMLISRANNDFYKVEVEGRPYALRVAKANFRGADEYQFEANYVNFLDSCGLSVPAFIANSDGEMFFEIEAPEGIRAISLMNWLEGKTFTNKLSKEDAFEMGAFLSLIHQSSKSFTSELKRPIRTDKIISERMPFLLSMLENDLEHLRFYEDTIDLVTKLYCELSDKKLSYGAVHGDYQFGNIMQKDSGGLAVLDFDTSGQGYLAEDILTFIWRSDMEIGDEKINESFISGYESIHALSDIERKYLPLFRVARDLVMSTTFAMLINRVGPVPGFDGNFNPFTDLVRKHLELIDI